MDGFSLQKHRPASYFQLIIGLFLLALGIICILKSNLGMSPWNVFHMGTINYLPLSLGRVTQITGIILIILSFFLGVSPGTGTILNMILVGFFIDLVNPFMAVVHHLPFRLLFLATGIMLIALGTGLYINSNLGAGPRDSLMLGLTKKTGKSVRFIRACIEITVLIIGFLLGGPVGIGTVAFSLSIGPSVQFFLKIIPKQKSSSSRIEK
jgi:uncharacterized membrane protein YczE